MARTEERLAAQDATLAPVMVGLSMAWNAMLMGAAVGIIVTYG